MRAVVLAAGDGTRLRPFTRHRPKPLTKLLGLSLLERVILTARKVGIRDFIVVTGHKAEQVRKHLGDGSRYGVRVEYAFNSQWHRGNGSSLLAAEENLRGEEHFLLLMGDHVIEPKLLAKALRQAPKGKDCLLCVDRDLDGVVDLRDATKVKIENGRVVQIEKRLRHFDGVDTGVFVLNRAVFDALRQADTGRSLTLTAGIRRLVEARRLRICDVSGSLWIDIDNHETLRIAERLLLRQLAKPTDGVISRWLNRPLSTQLTRFLVKTRLSPNFVTVASFLVAIASAALFAVGFLLPGGVLAQVSSILDGVDGEIARLKLQESRVGAFVDSLLDRYADAAILLGMSVWAYTSVQEPWTLLLGMAAMAGAPLSMLVKEKYKALTGYPYPLQEAEGVLRFLPDSRDARLFIIMLGGLTGGVVAALFVLATVCHLKTLWRVYRLTSVLDATAT